MASSSNPEICNSTHVDEGCGIGYSIFRRALKPTEKEPSFQASGSVNVLQQKFPMDQLQDQLLNLGKGESFYGAVNKMTELRDLFFRNSTQSLEYDSAFFKFRAQNVERMFEALDFDASFVVLKWLEDRQADSKISSPRIIFILNKFLVCDKQRKWESRFLKLFWRHSTGVSDSDLLFSLRNLVEHYSSSHEVGSLKEFMLTNDERATFLNNCSTLDIATCFAKDLEEGQKAKGWAQRDNILHRIASELAKPLAILFPFSVRFETAKECLDRLDLVKAITVDLNPDESDTLASVLSSFMSPELQALNALKKEMELHREVILQVEQLSGKHLHAYETLKKDQHERPNEFFHTCEEEKKIVVQEALYKGVKYLASIKKANINRHLKLCSEEILKRIVQKAGNAFKEVEGKLHKAESSEREREYNKGCALCFSNFSKKRKRACLDPCGHASACLDCATKVWVKTPNCPWCKAIIKKPIPVPAQIFL